MARILRGDIRWANLDPTQGREQKAGFPLTFLLDSAHMPRKSWYDKR